MSGPRAPWWMFLVAASFLGFFGLDLYVASPLYHGPGPLGLIFDNRSSWVSVERVEPGSIAERSGIRVGDRIVIANGMPIRRRVNWDVAGITFDVARPLLLVIEREGKRIELSLTLEPRTSLPLNAEFYLLAAADLLALALALVVAFRRPHDLVARVGAWFLATTAISNFPPLYGFGSVWRHLPAPIGALLWIADISELIFPAIFFTFFAIFPRPLFRQRWIWALVWTPSVLWMVSFLRVQYALVNETAAAITPGIITIPFYFALRGIYILGGLVVLVINYRRLEDINERRRMRVLVAGSIIGWVAIGLFLAFIVVGGGPTVAALSKTPFMPTMLVLYMLFPVSFAYAILRHRVFDLGVIVRQGLQYALASGVLLTAVPVLGLILIADLLLHGQRPLLEILRARGWIYAVLAALDLVAYVKRQTWLESLDRRFFRERFDAQRLLREVIEEIHKARSFTQVAPHVVARVEATLHPEFVAMLVREPTRGGLSHLGRRTRGKGSSRVAGAEQAHGYGSAPRQTSRSASDRVQLAWGAAPSRRN